MTLSALELPSAAHLGSQVLDFSTLYDEQLGFVWRNLRRLGVIDASLDDAVQDVFVVAHRRLGSFEGRSSPRTWLFGIARRVAKDYRRRTARKGLKPLPVPEGVEPVAAPDLSARVEGLQQLDRALSLMDAARREVFVLAAIEQLTPAEIAEALDENLNTVYSRLRAAREQFELAVAAGERVPR